MTRLVWATLQKYRKFALFLISVSLLATGLSQAGLGNVFSELGRIPTATLLGITLLFFANISIVSFRLRRILHQFGLRLKPSVISQANLQGHFAGLFILSIFGQIAGRQWVLRHYQVPPVFIATISGVERLILLLVSGTMFLWGILYLFGSNILSPILEKAFAFEIILTILLAGLTTYLFGRSTLEARILSNLLSWRWLRNLCELSIITAAAQGVVLTAFILGGRFIAPQAELIDILAAAAITSFAASMPISVNGWGVRELAAVFAFGHLGASAPSAIALSVMIGLCSTAVILCLYVISLLRNKDRHPASSAVTPPEEPQQAPPSPAAVLAEHPLERAGTLFLCLVTAILVFFQIHIPLPSGVISINLADPFAIIALAAIAMRCVAEKAAPNWRIRGVPLMLALFSVLIVFAFLNGAVQIGITQWALVGRVIGWTILLGYFSIGVLATRSLGTHGTRRVSETLFITGALIVLSHMIARALTARGLIPADSIPPNFEGYAGNRNAFALQMLIATTLLIAVSSFSERLTRFRKSSQASLRTHCLGFFLGCLFAGIAFSASRTGIVCAVIVMGAALSLRFVSLRLLLLAIGYGSAIAALFLFVLAPRDMVAFFSSKISSEYSDNARWASYQQAFDLWLDHPLLGSGLGVFIHRSTEWFSAPIVIHSTPLWLLTEFGLIGFLPISGLFVYFCVQMFRNRQRAFLRGAFLLMLTFAAFGLVHEILYQRIFWISLGVLIALPRAQRTPSPS